ncbi:MAG: hypothetical protein FWD82_00995 [Defluviitaleaceae bacterium]|nr:hypothetical protein [Defluviitaleaceae bacterium]
MDFSNLKGKLIVFSGLDGSGKSTQAKILRKSLYHEGRNVAAHQSILTASNVITERFTKSKEIQINQWCGTDAFCFTEAINDVKIIQTKLYPKLLLDDSIIIRSRYICCWLAVAIASGASNTNVLLDIFSATVKPVIQFHLDINHYQAMERIKMRAKKVDSKENEEFLCEFHRAYEVALKLFNHKIVRIDATMSVKKITDIVRTETNNAIN